MCLLVKDKVRLDLVRAILRSKVCTQIFRDPDKPNSLHLLVNPFPQSIIITDAEGNEIQGDENCFLGIDIHANPDNPAIYIIPADKNNQNKPLNYTSPIPH